MEAVIALILLGLFAIILLLILFYFIHPVWGIIDCAVSDRQTSEGKILWILLMVITGMLGSILYGLLGARAVLKRVTQVAVLITLAVVVAFVALAVIAPAVARKTLGNKLGRFQQAQSQSQSPAQPATAQAEDNPPAAVAPADITLEPFTAVHLVATSPTDWAGSVAKFDQNGPVMDTLLRITTPDFYPVNHLAVDPAGPTYYAITTHQVGKIVPSTGKFVALEIDPALPRLSWPSAIAFDSRNRKLVLAGRGAGYSYDPQTGEWKTIPGLEKVGLIALAFNPERGTFYGLANPMMQGPVNQMLEFNAAMAVVNTIQLAQPIDTGNGNGERKVQLACAAGRPVVLSSIAPSRVPSGGQKAPGFYMYVVQRDSGQVTPIRMAAR